MLKGLYGLIILGLAMTTHSLGAQEIKRVRDYGITIGSMIPGANNAITDVDGVEVGHQTLIRGTDIRTGVTVVLPYRGNIFQQKVPAAIYIGNGFGKLAGSTQVNELGNLETPIVLTNTLNVATGMEALIDYTLAQEGNEGVLSVNAVVGETNDGYLNDIRGRHVTTDDVKSAIHNAKSGKVEEGAVGAGTGTFVFGYKGGIGTASRLLEGELEGYTLGVLVQTNFGARHELLIDGVPVGRELIRQEQEQSIDGNGEGSIIVVVATDVPLDHRSLMRIARRGMMGIARTGGVASNGSGDYIIAFSTAYESRVPYSPERILSNPPVLHNDYMTPLFSAVIEATEEAILNALFAAPAMVGKEGRIREKLPLDRVLSIMKERGYGK